MLRIAYRATEVEKPKPKRKSKKEELHDACIVMLAKQRAKDKIKAKQMFKAEFEALEEQKQKLRELNLL